MTLIAGDRGAGRERGLRLMVLSAQTQALGFYERLGYTAYGPVFDDAGLPHRWMPSAGRSELVDPTA